MIGRIGTLVHQVLSVVVCSPKVASSGIFPTPKRVGSRAVRQQPMP